MREAWGRFRYRRLLRRMAGPKLLRAFAEAYPDAFFVEIGANDGSQHDHLRPFITSGRWRGIMVEPVPFVFARLQSNYAGNARVVCENAAITDRDGRLPFHHLAEASPDEDLPGLYDAIGSFSREAVLAHAHLIPDVEARLVTTEVPTLTFDSLCRRHAVERVDLVVIDTEGHDWEVIRTIDLERHRPRLLVHEHYHLSRADREASRTHLERRGYETMEEGMDTFSLDVTVEDGLTRRWRALEPALPGASTS